MKWMMACAAAMLFAVPAQAEAGAGPDQKMLKVMSGESKIYYPVISLPWEGAAPEDTKYSVRQSGTGRDYPATLRDGVLTFVPRGMKPETEYVFRVDAGAKDADYAPKVRIEQRGEEPVLDVFIEDALFTSYH